MVKWNIHESDGRYVGQHASYTPQIAFCEYMSLYGKQPSESDLQVAAKDDGSYQINYQNKEFILTALDSPAFTAHH